MSEAPPRDVRALQRSGQGRILGGVCAGLGRGTGLDPVVFRVVFAVLLFGSGIGILMYVAAFLLMKDPRGGPGLIEQWTRRDLDADAVLGLLAGLLSFGLAINVATVGMGTGTLVVGLILVLALLAAHAHGVDLLMLARTMPERLGRRLAAMPEDAPPVAPRSGATFGYAGQGGRTATHVRLPEGAPPYPPGREAGPYRTEGPSRAEAPDWTAAPSQGEAPSRAEAPDRAEGPSQGQAPVRAEGPNHGEGPNHDTGTDRAESGEAPHRGADAGEPGRGDGAAGPEAPAQERAHERRPPTGVEPRTEVEPPRTREEAIARMEAKLRRHEPGSGRPEAEGTRPLPARPPAPQRPAQELPGGAPFAPHGPYRPLDPLRPDARSPYDPALYSRPAPPPAQKPRRARSYIGLLTFFVAMIVGGILMVVQARTAGGPNFAVIGAAILVTIGAGLLVAAWWGRGAGLVALGTVVALTLAAGLMLDGLPTNRTKLNWTPMSVSEAGKTYAVGVGDGRLDLTELKLTPGARTTFNATVSVGALKVVVPPSARVEVYATAKVGDIRIDHSTRGGVDVVFNRVLQPETKPSGEPPTIVLNLRGGFGDVEVRRGA
ncbi:PspC domain-containing protein [Nonomuraea longicatena]